MKNYWNRGMPPSLYLKNVFIRDIWTYLNLSKQIGTSLYISEHLWTCLNKSKHLGTSLSKSEIIQIFLNIFEQLRTYLNICELIRTFVVTGTIFEPVIMFAWKTIEIDECLPSLDLNYLYTSFQFDENFSKQVLMFRRCLKPRWHWKVSLWTKRQIKLKKDIKKFFITFIGLKYWLIQIFLSTKSWNTSSSLSLSSSKHHDKSKFLYCFLLSQ